jgi:outer membrane protein
MRFSLLLRSLVSAPLVIFIASMSPFTLADESNNEVQQKNWELGLGLGVVAGPDYRGSDEYRSFISPIPYFIYRGKYIRSDRDGVRGNFLRTDKYEFTLSASASITPEADKSELREGMPELGSTLELGPAFNINLSGEDFSRGWQLQLPWRAVFALGADESGYIGSIIQPQLVYITKLSDWTFSYRAGLTYASDDYHDYYYSVAPKYATEQRATFAAKPGYSGWNNNFSFSRSFEQNGFKTRFAFFVRYDNIEHTDFSESPLVVSNHSARGGIAVIWVIK